MDAFLDQCDRNLPVSATHRPERSRENRPRAEIGHVSRPAPSWSSSWSESKTWRRQSGGPRRPDQVHPFRQHRARDECRIRSSVSRETPVAAATWSGPNRPRRAPGTSRRFAARRTWASRAVSAPGVTPSIRAAWPSVAGRTADSFSRASLDRPPIGAVVQVGRQAQVLVPPEGHDVGLLPVEIAGIGRLDLHLLGDCRRPGPASSGQIAAQPSRSRRRIGQQLQRRPAPAVGLDRDAVGRASLGVRVSDWSFARASSIGRSFHVKHFGASRADDAGVDARPASAAGRHCRRAASAGIRRGW